MAFKFNPFTGNLDEVVNRATDVNFTQSGAGAVTRTVASKLKDIVNVKDFGALGDGSDQTAALQAAIDYAESLLRGATVVFPEGTYLITSPLTIQKSGVSLQGGGREATYIQSNISSANGIIIASVDPFNGNRLADNRISGFTFAGFGTANPVTGVWIRAEVTQRTVIEDCQFFGKRQSIEIRGAGHGCVITNCSINSGSVLTAFNAGSAGIVIGQRQVASGVANAIQDTDSGLWYVSSYSLHISDIDCFLGLNYDSGIYIDSVDGLSISNSYIGQVGGSDLFYLASHTNQGCLNLFCSNVFFDVCGGKTIVFTRASGKAPPLSGVRFSSCAISGFGGSSSCFEIASGFNIAQGVHLSGCSIAGSSSHPVVLSSVSNSTITGCEIRGLTGSTEIGMLLTSCARVSVTGNTFNTLLQAIQTNTTADGLVFCGNTIGTTGSDPINCTDSSQEKTITQNRTKAANTIASASFIVVPLAHEVFIITGTTTINGITGAGFRGRQITLIFNAVLTVTQNQNIRFRSGTNFTSIANSAVTFVYEDVGNLWIQA